MMIGEFISQTNYVTQHPQLFLNYWWQLILPLELSHLLEDVQGVLKIAFSLAQLLGFLEVDLLGDPVFLENWSTICHFGIIVLAMHTLQSPFSLSIDIRQGFILLGFCFDDCFGMSNILGCFNNIIDLQLFFCSKLGLNLRLGFIFDFRLRRLIILGRRLLGKWLDFLLSGNCYNMLFHCRNKLLLLNFNRLRLAKLQLRLFFLDFWDSFLLGNHNSRRCLEGLSWLINLKGLFGWVERLRLQCLKGRGFNDCRFVELCIC